MRVIGLDVGTKTIGVAVSDTLGIIAQGLETYRRKPNDIDDVLEYLGVLIQKYEAKTIVMGLPLHMNGDMSEAAERVMSLGEEVEENYPVRVEYVDERLTTVQVTKTLITADVSRQKRRKVVDKLAAVVILQTYLDLKGGSEHGLQR